MQACAEFRYRLRLAYDTRPGTTFVFNVQLSQTRRQRSFHERLRVDGGRIALMDVDPCTATRFVHVVAEASQLVLSASAWVQLTPLDFSACAFADANGSDDAPVAFSPEACWALRPSRHCPSDRFRRIAAQLCACHPDPLERIDAIVRWVRARADTFSPIPAAAHAASTPSGPLGPDGASLAAVHLMIGLCRAAQLPARYVSRPDSRRPGLSAYAEVLVRGWWLSFDPSGYQTCVAMPRLGTGRDAADVPVASIFGAASQRTWSFSLEPQSDTEGFVREPGAPVLAWSSAAEGDLPVAAREATAAPLRPGAAWPITTQPPRGGGAQIPRRAAAASSVGSVLSAPA
jgi:transglutaminase-like putative cysteine protease